MYYMQEKYLQQIWYTCICRRYMAEILLIRHKNYRSIKKYSWYRASRGGGGQEGKKLILQRDNIKLVVVGDGGVGKYRPWPSSSFRSFLWRTMIQQQKKMTLTCEYIFIVDTCIEQCLDACINNSNLLKKESLLQKI